MRIIGFFDRLVENRADVHALVRAAADLAECPAGLRDPRGAVVVRYDEHGRPLAPARGTVSLDRAFGSDSDGHGVVWLERASGPASLDEMLLERMAVAADVIVYRADRGRLREGDPTTLLPVLLSGQASRAETRRIVGLLGFRTDRDLTTVAVRPVGDPADEAHALSAALGRAAVGLVRGTAFAEEIALVSAVELPADLVGDVLDGRGYAGLGGCRPIDRLGESWAQARTALRFARAGGPAPVVRFADLGPAALLAHVPGGESMRNPDVQVIARLAATAGGREELAMVEGLCRTGSLRRTAAELHMHHSSVAHRVQKVEQALGYSLDTPEMLFRAMLAIRLWRLGTVDD